MAFFFFQEGVFLFSFSFLGLHLHVEGSTPKFPSFAILCAVAFLQNEHDQYIILKSLKHKNQLVLRNSQVC